MTNRIEHLDDERALGHGYIVTLRVGWSFLPNEHNGVKGFDTKREALAESRQTYPCTNCPECDAIRRADEA